MSIYRARLRNTSNALSPRVCPANRHVFKSRLNCSESTAGEIWIMEAAEHRYNK